MTEPSASEGESDSASSPRLSGPAAFFKAPFASPAGFFRTALVIAACFGLAHAAGLREHTRFLSGTEPAGAGGDAEAAMGVLYTLLYFAFVIAAPIFAVGALVFAGLNRALKAPDGR